MKPTTKHNEPAKRGASIKLSPPQLDFLEKLHRGPTTAVETYAPVKKLVALGFATGSEGRYGQWTWTITDAGRAHYDALRK